MRKSEATRRYEELAAAMDEMRETSQVVVAGLVADGFTDEQARWLMVGVMTSHLRKEDTDD